MAAVIAGLPAGRRLRIAMFTDYFFPELGGIQDSIATLGRALGERGHQVDILAPRYGRADYARIGVGPGERDLGANVRVHRRASLPFPSSTRQSRAAMISPFARLPFQAGVLPDVVHVHSFFGVGLEALIMAGGRIPVIGTQHTTIAGFAGHMPVSVAAASSYARWFYNRCDRITAPSRSVFDELGDGLRPPCSVLSNPIDTTLFAPVSGAARAALRAEFGFTGPVVVHAGRLGAEKNIPAVLHGVARLAGDACLVLAGHGAQEAELRALAGRLGIAGRVRFVGTLPQAGLARLLAASDVFAIMSTSETQSMVLLQAMACGLPVVAANSRALPEFVAPETGLLVPPGDAAALAAALDALLADVGRRSRMGAAARVAAAAYRIDAVTDAWEGLYAAMLDRRIAA